MHFTSDRLRRDAIEDATKIISDFQQLAYSLNLAKRKDAREIQKSYQEKIEQAQKEAQRAKELASNATKEAEIAREDRLTMTNQLKEQSAVLQVLQDQLAQLTGQSSQ